MEKELANGALARRRLDLERSVPLQIAAIERGDTAL
jgi:hypothetical protein